MLKNLSLEFAFRKPKPVPVIGLVSWRGYRSASLNGEVCRMGSPIFELSCVFGARKILDPCLPGVFRHLDPPLLFEFVDLRRAEAAIPLVDHVVVLPERSPHPLEPVWRLDLEGVRTCPVEDRAVVGLGRVDAPAGLEVRERRGLGGAEGRPAPRCIN